MRVQQQLLLLLLPIFSLPIIVRRRRRCLRVLRLRLLLPLLLQVALLLLLLRLLLAFGLQALFVVAGGTARAAGHARSLASADGVLVERHSPVVESASEGVSGSAREVRESGGAKAGALPHFVGGTERVSWRLRDSD